MGEGFASESMIICRVWYAKRVHFKTFFATHIYTYNTKLVT